ncbi:MAG: sigma-54 dependent transcriptional regulator [Bacteroidia bacterium]
MERKILVVDDDEDMRLLLKRFFTKKGFTTETAGDGQSALELLKHFPADLAICDFKLPDVTGLDLIREIKLLNNNIQIILITGYSDVRIAVEALRKGAHDYVTKPLYPDELLLTVNQALSAESEIKSSGKNSKIETLPGPEYITGPSEQSAILQKHINLIAPTDMSVIILGETGTGKEYVARAIHQNSQRASKAFVAVDCGALPGELAGSELFGHIKGAFTGALNDKTGSFELADGGTLFLDEIGNLSYENQIKLLRVLQERKIRKIGSNKEIPIDVRVIVATNDNLRKSIENGEFREDIFHRLNEFKIELSPLRERKSDLIYFADYFIKLSNQNLRKQVKGFNDESIEILKNYYWHGNLRELKNIVKRAVLLSQDEYISPECLPDEIRNVYTDERNSGITEKGVPHHQIAYPDRIDFNIMSLKDVVEEAEKRAILQALESTNYNKSRTAELLGVDRKTLYNKIQSYQIEL